MVQHQLSTNM